MVNLTFDLSFAPTLLFTARNYFGSSVLMVSSYSKIRGIS